MQTCDRGTFGNQNTGKRRLTRPAAAALLAGLALATPSPGSADEGGVSFWLPGLFGSLAAAPAQPGWAFTSIYYHTSVEAEAGRTFRRGGNVVAGLDGRADLMLYGPTYVFAEPLFGAQAAISLFNIAGRNEASISATLTGPLGNTISGSRTDSLTAFGDLIPQATLKWHQGVHNVMLYATGDIPVGSYEARRLANLGIGHGAIDGGAGYTYFDPTKGHEFSVVTGFTYNLENKHTNYQNGIDWHTDWALSQFLNKQFFVGAVGYWYQQITGDSGTGAVLGPFKSRVGGIGPQFGYIFPVSKEIQGFLNVKSYFEFEAENRPEGWNLWVVLNFSPAEKQTAAQPVSMIRK
jgi:hypothetical protein